MIAKIYRPLPDYLTIKESSIEGLGLFATADIPKDKWIGYTHLHILGNRTQEDWVRLPLGGFYNHSDTPNCYSNNKGWFKELYSKEDIKAGEELTCKYDLYNVNQNKDE